MDQLCKYIYDNDQTDRVRTRAMLCQIYHLALHDKYVGLHNGELKTVTFFLPYWKLGMCTCSLWFGCRWYQARDLMLMSHLQDNIHAADIPTQVCLLP